MFLLVKAPLFCRSLATAIFCSCLIVSLPTYVNGQDKSDAKKSQIKCSITVEGNRFSKRQPVSVQIAIHNTSDKDVTFWAEYIFNLKTLESISQSFERLGDRYYSRSGIATKNGQLALVPKDLKKMVRIDRTTSRFVNEQVRLGKGETKQINVDLSELLWADGMSAFWPDEQFSKSIPNGKYRLWLETYGDGVKAVSNHVDIEIQ